MRTGYGGHSDCEGKAVSLEKGAARHRYVDSNEMVNLSLWNISINED